MKHLPQSPGLNLPCRAVARNREAGFSLLEVMMAVGVAAVLTYFISTMLVNSGKQAASQASKSDFNTFVNELQGAFNNTGTCRAALANYANPSAALLDFSGTTPPEITISLGTTTPPTVYGKGTTFGGTTTTANNRAVTITHLQLTGLTPTGPATAAGQQFVVPLYLEVSRGNPKAATAADQNAVGGNTLNHTFNLLLTMLKDSNGKYYIVGNGCAAQYTDFWVTSGGNPNDIVYTGGAVGVGVDPPAPGMLLDVAGLVQAQMFMYSSDSRLKENVRDIPDALSRVLRLRGVKFDWKDRTDAAGRDQLGLIAQEVEQVFPEAVRTNPENGLKSVSYGTLLAPIVEAVKEQKDMIAQQQREIDELKKALAKQ